MNKWSAGDGRGKRVLKKSSKGLQKAGLVQRRLRCCASDGNGWVVRITLEV